VFTELRTYTPVGQNKAIVDIGSRAQPFKLFLPDIQGSAGQEILRLLDDRYIPKEPDHVRRSYAYVHGPLKLFGDEPEVVVTHSRPNHRRTQLTIDYTPGMSLTGGGRGVPLDYDELKRSTRVGFERRNGGAARAAVSRLVNRDTSGRSGAVGPERSGCGA